MVYFDNAATTFPKPKCVYASLNDCVRKYCGNPGRSGHRLSLKAGEKIYEVREIVARFFNFDYPENVVFTYNATYALNLAIKSKITHKCHVIISDLEHNSVLRPINSLVENLGVEYSVFDSSGDITSSIEKHIREDTECIISTICSNVNGKRIPLSELSLVAKKHGLYLIVDASQSAGHELIDLKKTPCDVICAPGHKALFGIQGSGFAIFKSVQGLKSFIEGGSGQDSKNIAMPKFLPEKYEAGTLSTPTIVTLGSGIEFINDIGLNQIAEHCESVAKEIKAILANQDKIIAYDSYGGIVLFNVVGMDSSLVTEILNQNGICARGGLHCAPMAHKTLSTYESGAVRLSVSYFNSNNDIDSFYKTIRKLLAE